MRVGVCTIELRLHGCGSLKEKRRVLRSIKDRIRNRFNVSIAEVDCQDKWQVAVLGFSAVSNDQGHVSRTIERLISAVEGMGVAEVVDTEIGFY
jgi:uncharacterized protein YlxP (DUF503 family)